MLTKKKIHKPSIAHLFKISKRIFNGPLFDILCASPVDESLLVVVASRKVGNAIIRNKIRRQIKAIFYQEMLLKDNYSYIVITKPAIVGIPFHLLKQKLIDVLNQS